MHAASYACMGGASCAPADGHLTRPCSEYCLPNGIMRAPRSSRCIPFCAPRAAFPLPPHPYPRPACSAPPSPLHLRSASRVRRSASPPPHLGTYPGRRFGIGNPQAGVSVAERLLPAFRRRRAPSWRHGDCMFLAGASVHRISARHRPVPSAQDVSANLQVLQRAPTPRPACPGLDCR